MQNPPSPLTDWLDHLRLLSPPKKVVLVGAGTGRGPWVQWLMQQDCKDVVLIEGDEVSFAALQTTSAAREGWLCRKEVVASCAGVQPFHALSVSAESGLLAPEALHGLWPNLTVRHATQKAAVTLAEVLSPFEDQPVNWLLIDCWPALPMLQSLDEAALQALEVVVLRTWLAADPPAVLGQHDQDATLQALGFKPLETISTRHPAVGYTLMWRDRRVTQSPASDAAVLAEVADLRAQLADQTAQVKRLEAEVGVAEQQAKNQAQAMNKLRAEAEKEAKLQSLQQLLGNFDERLSLQLTSQQDGWKELQKQLGNRMEKGLSSQLGEQTSTKTELQKLKAEFEGKFADLSGLLKDNEARTKKADEQLSVAIKEAQKATAEQAAKLTMDAVLPRLTDGLAQQQAKQQDLLKEAEGRLRSDSNKGLSNAVRQIEAFIGIQNYMATGESLTNFHGWPISPDIGLFLLERLQSRRYDLIIEFGSGTSTLLFAKALAVQTRTRGVPASWDQHPLERRVLSFEHDVKYLESTRQLLEMNEISSAVELVHAPLVDWSDDTGKYLYYDCEAALHRVSQVLGAERARILVLVDGPPGATCANARYPAIPLIFSRLTRHQIDVVLDDANRPEEKAAIELWRRFWKLRGVRVDESTLASEKGLYLASV